MNKFLTLMLLAVVALMLVACAPKGPTATVVNVTLSEYKIALDKTSIPAGPVTFEIKNTGSLAHAFVLEPVGARNEPFELNGKKAEIKEVALGQTATLEWTIDTPGEYQLTCYTPGHFEQGMTTTFTVTTP